MGVTEKRAEIARRISAAISGYEGPQSALAAALGRATSALSSWRVGRTQPSLEVFSAFCELTGKSADEILGLRRELSEASVGEVAEASPAYETVEGALQVIDRRLERIERDLSGLRQRRRRPQEIPAS